MGNLFKWVLGVLAGCFGIGSVMGVALFASPVETPGIVIAQPDYNFGELSETAQLVHNFTVKNNGKAVLTIRDVQPS